MNGLPSGWLAQLGVAEFDDAAVEYVVRYSEYAAGIRDVDFVRSYLELGAAEFAIAPFYQGEAMAGRHAMVTGLELRPPSFPVRVQIEHANYAIFKTNCGPFIEHSQKAQGEIAIWDVFTFAGDMSKLELLGFPSDTRVLATNVEDFVNSLATHYMTAGFYHIVDSGLLAVQGLLWSAKLALLQGEDYTRAADLQFMDRFYKRAGEYRPERDQGQGYEGEA